MQKIRKRQFTFSSGYLLVGVGVLWALQAFVQHEAMPKQVPYSEFLSQLDAGRIKEVSVGEDEIAALLKPSAAAEKDKTKKPERIVTTRLPKISETQMFEDMRKHGVVFSGHVEKTSVWSALLFSWVLPSLMLFGIWTFTMRRIGKGSGPLSVGKAQAKIYDLNEKEQVTFNDVAGIDEAKGELVEI